MLEDITPISPTAHRLVLGPASSLLTRYTLFPLAFFLPLCFSVPVSFSLFSLLPISVVCGFSSSHYLATKQKQIKSADVGGAELQALENEIALLLGDGTNGSRGGKLQHAHIVEYLGMERKPESLSIFLEYVAGGTIRSLLDRFGVLEEQVVQAYTRQILFGLEYLHMRSVAHRDIKSSNILVTNAGLIKLADFGASVRVGTSHMDSGVKGTPCYMAPEVIRGQVTSTGWRSADIWSVGCTVIEMVKGRPPYSDLNPITAMYMIASSDSQPDLPDALSASGREFLTLCFDRDPGCRAEVARLLLDPWTTAVGAQHRDRWGLPERPTSAGALSFGRPPRDYSLRGVSGVAHSGRPDTGRTLTALGTMDQCVSGEGGVVGGGGGARGSIVADFALETTVGVQSTETPPRRVSNSEKGNGAGICTGVGISVDSIGEDNRGDTDDDTNGHDNGSSGGSGSGNESARRGGDVVMKQRDSVQQHQHLQHLQHVQHVQQQHPRRRKAEHDQAQEREYAQDHEHEEDEQGEQGEQGEREGDEIGLLGQLIESKRRHTPSKLARLSVPFSPVVVSTVGSADAEGRQDPHGGALRSRSPFQCSAPPRAASGASGGATDDGRHRRRNRPSGGRQSSGPQLCAKSSSMVDPGAIGADTMPLPDATRRHPEVIGHSPPTVLRELRGLRDIRHVRTSLRTRTRSPPPPCVSPRGTPKREPPWIRSRTPIARRPDHSENKGRPASDMFIRRDPPDEEGGGMLEHDVSIGTMRPRALSGGDGGGGITNAVGGIGGHSRGARGARGGAVGVAGGTQWGQCGVMSLSADTAARALQRWVRRRGDEFALGEGPPSPDERHRSTPEETLLNSTAETGMKHSFNASSTLTSSMSEHAVASDGDTESVGTEEVGTRMVRPTAHFSHRRGYAITGLGFVDPSVALSCSMDGTCRIWGLAEDERYDPQGSVDAGGDDCIELKPTGVYVHASAGRRITDSKGDGWRASSRTSPTAASTTANTSDSSSVGVCCMTWSREHAWVCSGGQDGSLCIFDLETQKPIRCVNVSLAEYGRVGCD